MRRTAVLGAKRAAAAAPLLRAQLRGTAGHAMATIPPPQGLLRPLAVPQRLLLGPGPSNVPPRILAAGGRQLLGHMHPEMLQVMDEIKAGIQYAFQTRNRLTLAVSGTGHCAMEAALLNLLERGNTVLVAVNGIWGQRAADIAGRLGAEVRELQKPPGEYFSLRDIQEGLARHKPSVLFITHGESSTGVLQPLQGLGELCHRSARLPAARGCGGVARGSTHPDGPAGDRCPVLGVPESPQRPPRQCPHLIQRASKGEDAEEEDKASVLLPGHGLAGELLGLRRQATHVRAGRPATCRFPSSPTPPSSPKCSAPLCGSPRRGQQGPATPPHRPPSSQSQAPAPGACTSRPAGAEPTRVLLGFCRYHHTAPINSFLSLREGLAMLAELGLERSWERHRANCTLLCQGLRELGLELFVKEEAARLPTITTVRVPEGYAWQEITAFLMNEHGLEIAGGLGPSVGKVLRIGLMGYNSTKDNVDRVLGALRDALQRCRRSRL